MKYLFVGSIVDSKTINDLKDGSVAGNKMQLGFIKGLVDNEKNVKVLSVEPHAMWKFNDNPLFVKNNIYKECGFTINTISYINIPIVKQFDVIKKLKNRIKREIDGETIIIVYNTMSIFARPVLWAKRKYGCKVLSIVADLPIKVKKNIFRRYEDKKQIDYISKFDGLITLTKHIGDDFAPELPQLVIEAGCSNFEPKKTSNDRKANSIVFSGTLNSLSGIELILEAMRYVEESIELFVYGDGSLKNKVIEYSNIDKRIHYCGKISNQEMIKIQEKSGLLICPRMRDDFTTRYTFPSKILEYICSGTPVLANTLDGIPDEYSSLINFSDNELPQTWGNAINNIFSNYSSYIEKARKAREYVFKFKNWKGQSKKIIDCFEGDI